MTPEHEKRAHELAGRIAAARDAAASLPFADDVVALVRAAAANAPAGQLRSTELRVLVLGQAADHYAAEAAKPGAHAAMKMMANELHAMKDECFEDVKHQYPDWLESEAKAGASVTEQLSRLSEKS